jgi:S1-C subfamily serine protease
MVQDRRTIILELIFLAALLAAFALFLRGSARQVAPAELPNSTQAAASNLAIATSTASSTPVHPTATNTTAPTSTAATAKKPLDRATDSPSAAATAERVASPYAVPPLSFTTINDDARSAIVNIFCLSQNGSLHPISGSGVLIDPRGIILTNAHVAQYVLLAESGRLNFQCYVRTGSPATIRWVPEILYMPSVWVEEHAADITSAHPTGTGEHDYALLYIVRSADGAPLPERFPYLSPDTRDGIGFVGDSILAGGYPAEFVGPIATYNLYAASSVSTIKQLFTFASTSIDAISVGGVIEAQSGSSGGAIVNAWDRLIGIITTTSNGDTTAQRDLRGITLGYINRDLSAQTGFDLEAALRIDPRAQTANFAVKEAPLLWNLLLKQLTSR